MGDTLEIDRRDESGGCWNEAEGSCHMCVSKYPSDSTQ